MVVKVKEVLDMLVSFDILFDVILEEVCDF